MLNQILLLSGTKIESTIQVEVNNAIDGVITVSAISPIGDELAILVEYDHQILELPMHTTIYFRAVNSNLKLAGISGLEIQETSPNANQVNVVITKVLDHDLQGRVLAFWDH